MKINPIICCALIIILGSCSVGSPQKSNIESTSSISTRCLDTLVPTQIIFSVTPSPTTIPVSFRENAIDTYKNILLVIIDISMLNGLAEYVQNGEVQSNDKFGYLLFITAFFSATNDKLSDFEPNLLLTKQWEWSIESFENAKRLLSQWYQEEIDAQTVLDGLAPTMGEMDGIISEADTIMLIPFGYNAEEMKTLREEYIEEIQNSFEVTPTPTMRK